MQMYDVARYLGSMRRQGFGKSPEPISLWLKCFWLRSSGSEFSELKRNERCNARVGEAEWRLKMAIARLRQQELYDSK